MENILNATASVLTEQIMKAKKGFVKKPFTPSFAINESTVVVDGEFTEVVGPAPAADKQKAAAPDKESATATTKARIADMMAKAKDAAPKADAIKEKGKSIMTKAKGFSIKDNGFIRFIRKATSKVVGFVKKHAFKSVCGLLAITVAGTFTTGMLPAVAVGMGLYAIVSATVSALAVRKAGDQVDAVAIALNATTDSFKYAFVAATTLMLVGGVLTALLVNTAVYAYVGYNYMGYFIVA